MALRVCPECSEPVSEHAASCPHCGFPARGAHARPDRIHTAAAVAAIATFALATGVAAGWTMRARVRAGAAVANAPVVAAAPVAAVARVAAVGAVGPVAAGAPASCDCLADDHDESIPENATARAAATLTDAQDAYVHGDYLGAIHLAHRAMPADPARAWRVIGAASCFRKDGAAAHQAWSQLDPQARAFLEYVCSRNKVALP